MSELEENGDGGRRCVGIPVTALSNEEEDRSGGIRLAAIEVEETTARPNNSFI